MQGCRSWKVCTCAACSFVCLSHAYCCQHQGQASVATFSGVFLCSDRSGLDCEASFQKSWQWDPGLWLLPRYRDSPQKCQVSSSYPKEVIRDLISIMPAPNCPLCDMSKVLTLHHIALFLCQTSWHVDCLHVALLIFACPQFRGLCSKFTFDVLTKYFLCLPAGLAHNGWSRNTLRSPC